MYLTAVETNAAIVCACVMTLKPLVAKIFPKWMASRDSRGSSDSSTQQGPGSFGRVRGGPPTIGSRPSKAPISPVDSELAGMGIGDGGGAVPGVRSGAWREGPGGYVEIDEDGWHIDLELADTKREESEKEKGDSVVGRKKKEDEGQEVPVANVEKGGQ